MAQGHSGWLLAQGSGVVAEVRGRVVVARASRTDLPKTLWEQEREGERQNVKVGGNEKRSLESGLDWGQGLALGVSQGFGSDADLG